MNQTCSHIAYVWFDEHSVSHEKVEPCYAMTRDLTNSETLCIFRVFIPCLGSGFHIPFQSIL